MKELTIEQKAQRYDEAIEKARHYHSEMGSDVCCVLEECFSELKESEDERIRKNCIHFLELQKQHHAATFEIEECISWLEKIIIPSHNDVDSSFIEDIKGVIAEAPLLMQSDKEKMIAWLEKQRKQTYVKWSYDEGKQIQINPSEYINDMGGNGCYLKNTAQDSACSEEDEKYMSAIIKMVEHCSFSSIGGITKAAAIDWLKSLKDKAQPQPNQGWSEEDEKIVEALNDYVKNLDIFFSKIKIGDKDILSKEFREKVQHWFKSLKGRVQPQNLTVTDEELAQAKKDAYNDVLDKIEYDSENPTFDDGWSAAIWYLKKRNAIPQSQWKPTEKQLKSLEIACDRNDIVGYRLTQILKELKKLKGE